jgi:HEAT repeat protein
MKCVSLRIVPSTTGAHTIGTSLYRVDVDIDDLVAGLADKARRIDAIRMLVGGVTATELRSVELTDDVFAGLVRGTQHDNPVVRWWSVQLLDHCPNERATAALVPLFDDPIPRVRRNAVHAVGCPACKPTATMACDPAVLDRLRLIARDDPSPKVRAEAVLSIARLSGTAIR